MRYVLATLLIVLLLAVGIFAVQNTQQVTVGFLHWSVSTPLALLIILVYLMGMSSGGTVFSFVRRSIQRVGEPPRGR
jgi:lipopolysaccharide assembly protein A